MLRVEKTIANRGAEGRLMPVGDTCVHRSGALWHGPNKTRKYPKKSPSQNRLCFVGYCWVLLGFHSFRHFAYERHHLHRNPNTPQGFPNPGRERPFAERTVSCVVHMSPSPDQFRNSSPSPPP